MFLLKIFSNFLVKIMPLFNCSTWNNCYKFIGWKRKMCKILLKLLCIKVIIIILLIKRDSNYEKNNIIEWSLGPYLG